MIVITGANGQLGKAVAERLLSLIPAEQFGLSVRQPEMARTFAERGVRVRRGDFIDTESLHHAFEGASEVLIVSTNTTGEDAIIQHKSAIDSAKYSGARRILYTSHMGSNMASMFAPMPGHAATEDALRSSGLAFTSLRNGFYAASAIMLMGKAFETGKLIAPEDGPVSWTTHADLAEATAIALLDEKRLSGITSPLTGSESLNLADLASLAAKISGRSIQRVTVSDDEFRAHLLSDGMPESRCDMFLGLFIASRKGEFSAVDSTLENLLGRKPISMQEVLTSHLSK